jgi:hypothetical protein
MTFSISELFMSQPATAYVMYPSLTTKTHTTSDMFENHSILTQLITSEEFTAFNCHDSLKIIYSYYRSQNKMTRITLK